MSDGYNMWAEEDAGLGIGPAYAACPGCHRQMVDGYCDCINSMALDTDLEEGEDDDGEAPVHP